MDLSFSAEDLEFQQSVRSWLEENLTQDLKDAMARSGTNRLGKADQITWQKRLFERGWAAPSWPVEHGGPGFTVTQRYLYDLEMARAGAPGTVPFGITMVAPVIMKFGTEEQKKEFLPDILATNKWWCQGYSEPGSGSDLASLACRADRDGDHYVINGAKTWTTLAQHADMMFVLVRTSNEDIRQKGISFLLVDMTTPGIEVKPIITIDGPKPGRQEINTVFFEDVRVPVSNRVGEEGKGWTYAKYLLEFERGNAYSHGLLASLGGVRELATTIEDGDGSLADNPDFRQKINDVTVQVHALEFTELRILGQLAAGQNVGPESSLLKTRGTELQQALTELSLEAVGNYALPADPFLDDGANEAAVGPDPQAVPEYFNTRKVSIYAGSNEIQRNIMAKLVLGL